LASQIKKIRDPFPPLVKPDELPVFWEAVSPRKRLSPMSGRTSVTHAPGSILITICEYHDGEPIGAMAAAPTDALVDRIERLILVDVRGAHTVLFMPLAAGLVWASLGDCAFLAGGV